MSPEFGSTCAIFPIDAATIDYLRLTGRPDDQLDLVEQYAKAQGLWHDPDRELRFSEELTLDLSTVVPSIAGPKRPQDRIELANAKPAFRDALPTYTGGNGLNGTFPASDADRQQRHPPDPPGQDHPGGRHGDRTRPRPRGHRGDHLLHQHLQPVRDDRRRAAGEEGRGEGPEPQALGEDHPRAGLEGRHGLLRAGRPDPVPGQARLQPRRLRLHHLHRQLRPAAAGDQRRRSTTTTSPW